MFRILARAKAATDHAQLINSGHEKQKGLVSEPPSPGEALPEEPTVPNTGPRPSEKGKKGAMTRAKLRMSPSKGVKRNRGGLEKALGRKFGVPKELVKATMSTAPAGERAPLKALRGGGGTEAIFAGGLEESQSGRDTYTQSPADLPALDGLNKMNGTAEDEMEEERQYSPSSMGMDVFKEAELRGLVEQMTGGGDVRRELEPSQGLGAFLDAFGNSCGSFAAALAREGFSEGFPFSETAASGEETVEKGGTERLELGPREVSDFVAQVGLHKPLSFP
jgi:hypothetical protein